MEIPSPDEWVINEDSVEVTTTIKELPIHTDIFCLETQQQELQGWNPQNTLLCRQH